MNNNWLKRWFDLADLVASWSKDRSRKCGCVVVDDRNNVLSLGWNGFPRGVNDDTDSRHERPEKYLWSCHSEENAVCNAAAKGIPLLGGTMVVSAPLFCCARCSRQIAQSGIGSVYTSVSPDFGDAHFGHEFSISMSILKEANVNVFCMDDKSCAAV